MKTEIVASLKSIETENYLDRIFYRPIGFKIAKALIGTGITPNMITILSLFVGSVAGVLWYFPYSLIFAVVGILSLIVANIMDCVDGQLARLTGIKSEIGRILDGFAGDFWFLLIYIAFAHRLNVQFDTWLFWLAALLMAVSHLNQAAITDYYKTLHLFFISKEKGKEFESSERIRARIATMPAGVNRFFSRFYLIYTLSQEKQTPEVQKYLAALKEKYGEDIPEDVRLAFRTKSRQLLPMIDMMTFNGLSGILFLSVLLNAVWIYLVWVIVILNIVNKIIRLRHEKMCKSLG